MTKSQAAKYVIAAASLWGCISLFAKGLYNVGLEPLQVTAIRVAVGTLGLGAFLLATDASKLRIRPRDIWLFVGTGVVSLTLFNLCYFTMVQQSEPSLAVVLLYTSPAFVMLMSALLFKERITLKKIGALVLTLAGCVLVAGLFGGSITLSPLMLLIGVASGFFYATYSIFGTVALKRYHPLTVAFYTFAAALVCTLLFCDYSAIGQAVMTDASTIGYILGIGVLCTILPYALYNQGLKHLEASHAGILATAEPVVGALIGIFVFGDTTDATKLLGMAFILASAVLLSLGSKPETERLTETGHQPQKAASKSVPASQPATSIQPATNVE